MDGAGRNLLLKHAWGGLPRRVQRKQKGQVVKKIEQMKKGEDFPPFYVSLSNRDAKRQAAGDRQAPLRNQHVHKTEAADKPVQPFVAPGDSAMHVRIENPQPLVPVVATAPKVKDTAPPPQPPTLKESTDRKDRKSDDAAIKEGPQIPAPPAASSAKDPARSAGGDLAAGVPKLLGLAQPPHGAPASSTSSDGPQITSAKITTTAATPKTEVPGPCIRVRPAAPGRIQPKSMPLTAPVPLPRLQQLQSHQRRNLQKQVLHHLRGAALCLALHDQTSPKTCAKTRGRPPQSSPLRSVDLGSAECNAEMRGGDCKFIGAVTRHGADPDKPRMPWDLQSDHRVCNTALTDGYFRRALWRRFRNDPRWNGVDFRDPRQVLRSIEACTVGRVRFPVLFDPWTSDICLWRAVQGHSEDVFLLATPPR